MHIARTIHLITKVLFGILGLTLNGYVIFLCLHKTRSQNKKYSRVFLFNAIFDLYFALLAMVTISVSVNTVVLLLFFVQTFQMTSGKLIFITDNGIKNTIINYIVVVLWGVCYFMTNSIFTFLHWYRYSSLTNHYSISVFKAAFLILLFILSHTVVLCYFFLTSDKNAQKILMKSEIYSEDTPVVIFMIDMVIYILLFEISLQTKNKEYIIFFFELLIVLCMFYCITIYYAWKSWKHLRNNLKIFCGETVKLQKDVAKTLILQVRYSCSIRVLFRQLIHVSFT